MTNKAIQLLKKSESCVLHPYLDPSNVPTIGWGNTFYPDGKRVKMTDKPLTQAQADKLFVTMVANFEANVKKVLKVHQNENQISALTNFAYNVGFTAFKNSTLLKKINLKSPINEIEFQFNQWTKSKGKVLLGLVKRRKQEFELYNSISLSSSIIIPVILFFFTVFTISL